ncbi:MAG TPA: FG-GAP-like repeat-containing protein, partial [Myxococcota bacterium]|nr:FG-GAP-like repeat-containing protein [Myxococcota bacterium]
MASPLRPSLTRSLSVVAALTLASAASATSGDPPKVCEVVPEFTPSFEPVLEWEWTGSSVMPNHKQVMMTPVVIDVSGDGVPDVVFNSFAGSNYASDGVMRAIDGATGTDLWPLSTPTYRVRGAASIAAGDIDHDGRPELCTAGPDGHVSCYEHDGTYKFGLSGSANDWGGPSFADLNGDGSVEIINGNRVYSATGAPLWTGADGSGGPTTGPVSFAADIDGDGFQEVINDRAIYRHDGSVRCVNTSIPHGLAGVGDFDADPLGEVVIVGSGSVYLMDDDCALLWSAPIPGGGQGGAPNVADFDGDGQPEIGVAGASRYVVYDTSGAVLWSSVVQDFSSNRTGSSTFDFEGDGLSEVVYADERRLRVYDGATGFVRFDVPHASGTTYENPVIADVDADGNAEVITCANNYAFAGPAGIRVWRDANDGWVNTRGVWNQHAYAITNINDDGSIPAVPATNWLVPGLNNFRSNSQGSGTASPFAAPDLIVDEVSGVCIPDSFLVHLSARVGNDGDAPASAGVSVAFYLGDPDAGGTLLGVSLVGGALAPASSVEVTLDVVAPGGAGEIYARVDDDGAGAGSEAECDEENNESAAQVDLGCTPNQPPVADCGDVVVFADLECLGDGSVDNGSYDPDGDPIGASQAPAGPFGPGTTAVELTVCDDGGLCDTCQGSVTVIDDAPPTVDCGAPATIAAPGEAVVIQAVGLDNCDVAVAVADLTCAAVDRRGAPVDVSGACVVDLVGDTVTIRDSGGASAIGWTASAVDASGNGISVSCSVRVEAPEGTCDGDDDDHSGDDDHDDGDDWNDDGGHGDHDDDCEDHDDRDDDRGGHDRDDDHDDDRGGHDRDDDHDDHRGGHDRDDDHGDDRGGHDDRDDWNDGGGRGDHDDCEDRGDDRGGSGGRGGSDSGSSGSGGP